jgi:hypothetical protein
MPSSWGRAVDLTPLDPLADPARRRRLLGRLRGAAAAELARRRARLTVWGCLAAWRRPLLTAAGVVAVAASLTLMAIPRTAATAETLAAAAGMPPAWDRLSRGLDAPAPELLLQLSEGRP